jgi:DDE family transposase
MKGPDGFVQGYNTQVAVEPVFQLIVGQTVTQATNDKQQVVPLIEAIREQSGQKPEQVLTDNGYCSEENLKYLEKRRIEGFVATEKQKHNERSEPCKRGPLPEDASRVERMKRKLNLVASALSDLGDCPEQHRLLTDGLVGFPIESVHSCKSGPQPNARLRTRRSSSQRARRAKTAKMAPRCGFTIRTRTGRVL